MYLVFFAGLVLLDQLTKIYADWRWLNTNNNELYILASLSVLVYLIYVRRTRRDNILNTKYYILTTIMAGGASNLLDRLAFGGVRDVFMLGEVYFNVADIYVAGGGIAFLTASLFHNYIDKRHVYS